MSKRPRNREWFFRNNYALNEHALLLLGSLSSEERWVSDYLLGVACDIAVPPPGIEEVEGENENERFSRGEVWVSEAGVKFEVYYVLRLRPNERIMTASNGVQVYIREGRL